MALYPAQKASCAQCCLPLFVAAAANFAAITLIATYVASAQYTKPPQSRACSRQGCSAFTPATAAVVKARRRLPGNGSSDGLLLLVRGAGDCSRDAVLIRRLARIELVKIHASGLRHGIDTSLELAHAGRLGQIEIGIRHLVRE